MSIKMSEERWCHASCCGGSQKLPPEATTHDMQMILDMSGVSNPFQPDEQEMVLNLMLDAYRLGKTGDVGSVLNKETVPSP